MTHFEMKKYLFRPHYGVKVWYKDVGIISHRQKLHVNSMVISDFTKEDCEELIRDLSGGKCAKCGDIYKCNE